MRFVVFTHAQHYKKEEGIFSYAPYVREMDLWFQLVQEVQILAPLKNNKDQIDSPYERKDIKLRQVSDINFTSFQNSLKSILRIPGILFVIYRAMLQTDHIHIRCPGNIGLLACIVQVFFPQKSKTIKYAGNWDPLSRQPMSYRFQKWILRNEFYTRNAKVIVYGKWPDQGRNIVPFFTSSYSDSISSIYKKEIVFPYRFVFVGSLIEGKRPLLAVQIIHSLVRQGQQALLDIYGAGPLEDLIKKYIEKYNLNKTVILHGNQNSEVILNAYKKAHFSILPSKSEGWPKAVAEGMFFGAIPVSTKISCLEWMLGFGERGIIIEPELEKAVETIEYHLNTSDLKQMSQAAQQWSQQYTIERLTHEIEILMSN